METFFQFEFPRMKLRRHCQQLGLCFFLPLLFHLSRAFLGAWRFGLSHCVYSSFHNRLDLIREPAFYWVFSFIFPIYPCLFHHDYVKLKEKRNKKKRRKVLFVLVQQTIAISWPPWVRVWVWASDRFLPFTFFLLACPFVSRVYVVHLRCTSDDVNLTV